MNKKTIKFFESVASKITCWTGSFAAFALAFFIVIIWLVSGPFFHYSDTW